VERHTQIMYRLLSDYPEHEHLTKSSA